MLVYATVAVASGFADTRMRAYPAHVVTSYIPGIIANTDGAPGVYRVLVPFLVYGLAQATGIALGTSWFVTRLAWFFAAYICIHYYARTWFREDGALAAVLLVAATLPLTFTNSWAHPDHIAELALFTLGACTIARGHDGWFALVLPVAALNRETAAFLVLLYAVARPWTRAHLLRTVCFGAEFLAIYLGLRLARGLQHYDYWQFARNIEFLRLLPSSYDFYYRAYAYFGIVLFGPAVYLAFRSIEAPPFARRALLVVPVFVAVAMLFSSIIESRIFTPVYALVLPALLSVFFAPIERSGDHPL